MKKSILLLLISFSSMTAFAQFKDVMVIHKNDNSTVNILTDDIKNVTFDQQFITTVTTGDAKEISENKFELSGTFTGDWQLLKANVRDVSEVFRAGFFISTSGTPSSINHTGDIEFDDMVCDNESQNNEFTGIAENLTPGTTYYYRAYIWVKGVYYYGETKSFTTKAKLGIITGYATNITSSSATLSGTVTEASSAVTAGIIYGTSSNLSATNGTKKSITSSGNYTISLTGLNADTYYYYRAFVLYNGEYLLGEVKNFKTEAKTYAVGDYYPNDDNPKGIVWQVSASGKSGWIMSCSWDIGKWNTANTWCNNQGSGWSLPTKDQLKTIASNYSKLQPKLSANNYMNRHYWTSTIQSTGLSTNYYVVYLVNGEVTYIGSDSYSGYFAVKAF